jgi:hypothetical protein
MRFPTTLTLSLIFYLLTIGLATAQSNPDPNHPNHPNQPQNRTVPMGAMALRAISGNSVRLLQNNNVQVELKLDQAQIQKAKELDKKFLEEMRQETAGRDTDELRRKLEEWHLKKATKRGEELAAGVLKPEQAKRLKEISLQRRGAQAYTDAEVAKALALSDTQKDRIQGICSGEEKKMKDIVAMREWKARQSLQKETNEKAAAVLTEAQKKTWGELTGKPFEFQ